MLEGRVPNRRGQQEELVELNGSDNTAVGQLLPVSLRKYTKNLEDCQHMRKFLKQPDFPVKETQCGSTIEVTPSQTGR